ncbi:MAG TPA: PadR family transcriptional regulator [Terriglobales bacterium]|nr:PadR family transcriptional regulator [Terriglobales bacterium]
MSSVPTSLEFALLGLVRMHPQSGYDLRKTFSSTPLRAYSDSPGSIYPALRRMEAKQWIVATAEKDSNRKRQVYRVTATGKKALVYWLQKPVTRDDIVWRLNDLILRFAFLDGNVPRRATLRFLGEFDRELDSYLRDLRSYSHDSGMNKSINTGTLAFQFGVEGFEANLAWVRRVRKQLEGDQP